MKIKYLLDDGAFPIEKAHREDAGLDIRTPKKFDVPARGSAIVDTGVHVEIPFGYVGMIKSKSGLNVKNDLVAEGVVDCGYSGSIVVKLYNNGNKNKVFEIGDKITQLVIMPIPDIEMVQVSDITEFVEYERGNKGFGSTGI